MPHKLHTGDKDFAAQFEKFLNLRQENEPQIRDTVTQILHDVKERGDAAVLDYTERFDQHRPYPLRLDDKTIHSQVAQIPEKVREALMLSASRIRAYHEKQLPAPLDYTDAAGVRLGTRWTSVHDVGMYVPGGLAAYPSSVLMNAVPAKVAGVKRLVMVVPAPKGELNPIVLAAAQIAGVDEIYPIGGAQAVAALAYGTHTIKPVHKIVGPGNAYVAEAKRQVFGIVGIDMIAGPSEILVVADKNNNSRWIAADLLSQAEHDALAQSILLTDDADFAQKVEQEVQTMLQTLPRSNIASASWENYGSIILVKKLLEEAPALVDAIAPEHIELAVANPDALMQRIHHAGAFFLGAYTPEAVGDYLAGPSHVLPTVRTARFSSGLSVYDFMKRSSIIACSQSALEEIGPAVETLAEAEGLDAHALSVKVRRE